ncbi:MAG: HAD family hydrolase [Phycisphaerales bacterium]
MAVTQYSHRRLSRNMSGATFAFLDVDGTLVNCTTITSFERFWQQTHGGAHALFKFETWLASAVAKTPRAELNSILASRYRGRRVRDVEEAVINWITSVNGVDGITLPGPLKFLRQLQDEGVIPVLVSGSPTVCLEPLASALGISVILGLELEWVDECFTGSIVPPQTIGFGKLAVIERFLRDKRTCVSSCLACGDHISDYPMLSSMGRAYVVAGDSRLESLAVTNGWQIIPRGDE